MKKQSHKRKISKPPFIFIGNFPEEFYEISQDELKTEIGYNDSSRANSTFDGPYKLGLPSHRDLYQTMVDEDLFGDELSEGFKMLYWPYREREH